MSLLRSVSRPQVQAASRAVTGTCTTRTSHQARPSATYDNRQFLDYEKTTHVVRYRRESGRGEMSWEDAFISSLARAGTCRSCLHSRKNPHTWRSNYYRHERRRSVTSQYDHVKGFTSSAVRSRRTPSAPFGIESSKPDKSSNSQSKQESSITREEYKHLVNLYEQRFEPDEVVNDTLPAGLLPQKKQHFPLASRLVYTAEQEEEQGPRQILPPEDDLHASSLDRFASFLQQPFGHVSLDALWAKYTSLRSPRLRYISDPLVEQLFRHLSWVESKDKKIGERYLALLDECLGEHVPLKRGIWNTAVSFAGKWQRKISTADVQRAVELWKRMEENGVKADNVTFNILFDIAVKAGRFALADTIFRELSSRDLPLNRYLRISVIYYAGLRRDGDAVRQSFQDLVDAGEIVDTSVMNAVILSLVRAGEAAAAENVFLKMKRLHESKLGIENPPAWQERKHITIELNKVGSRLRKEGARHSMTFFGSPRTADERREKIQQHSPIAPDAWTYGILMKWYCETSGDMATVRTLLEEMRQKDLFTTNAIYIVLFRGFIAHGGHAYTDWSRRSLEEFWSDFLSLASPGPPEISATDHNSEKKDPPRLADDDPTDHDPTDMEAEPDGVAFDEMLPLEHRPPHFTRTTVANAIRAFRTCAGRPRMLEVWEDVQERWVHMTEEDRVHVQSLVDHYVKLDKLFLD